MRVYFTDTLLISWLVSFDIVFFHVPDGENLGSRCIVSRLAILDIVMM